MAESGQFFSFDGETLQPTIPGNDSILLVADSWLVDDGRVRSLQQHFERFQNSIQDPSVLAELPKFFEEVIRKLPRDGRWFPRIELHDKTTNDSRLHLRLRTAPEQQQSIVLWTHPESDPRTAPLIKGPDLSLAMQLRRGAQMRGADEAVILNSDGFIAEGALSSILWWRADVLCAPGPDIIWLPSVTRNEVFAIAEQMGITTRFEKAKPADLVGLEIWAVSSLQGILAVDQWLELGSPVGKPTHFEPFQKRLKMLSKLLN